jgi:hypothetical protein
LNDRGTGVATATALVNLGEHGDRFANCFDVAAANDRPLGPSTLGATVSHLGPPRLAGEHEGSRREGGGAEQAPTLHIEIDSPEIHQRGQRIGLPVQNGCGVPGSTR